MLHRLTKREEASIYPLVDKLFTQNIRADHEIRILTSIVEKQKTSLEMIYRAALECRHTENGIDFNAIATRASDCLQQCEELLKVYQRSLSQGGVPR